MKHKFCDQTVSETEDYGSKTKIKNLLIILLYFARSILKRHDFKKYPYLVPRKVFGNSECRGGVFQKPKCLKEIKL